MKVSNVLAFISIAALTACHKFNPSSSSKQIQLTSSIGPSSPIQSLSDIAAPSSAQVNMESSLIVGSQDRWLGRLVYEVDEEPLQTWLFLQREMPKIGWQLASAVHGKVSLLTFKRGVRFATIQIESKILSGSTVTINVSPEGGSQPENIISNQSSMEDFSVSSPRPSPALLDDLTPPVKSPPIERTIIQ